MNTNYNLSKADFNMELTNKNQIINYMLSHFKKENQYKTTLKLDHLIYNKSDYSNVSYYKCPNNHSSLHYIMNDLILKNWVPSYENHSVTNLYNAVGTILPKPGGQVEIASNYCSNLNEIQNSFYNLYKSINPILQKNNIGIYNLGYNPKLLSNKKDLINTKVYEIIRNHYQEDCNDDVIDIMNNSCSTTINIDSSSEEDLCKKFKIAVALKPIISGLFSNSPFHNLNLTDYLSYRSYKLNNMSINNKINILEQAFEQNFTVEKYIDYAIQSPLLYIYKDNSYIKIPNKVLFKDYLTGKYKYKAYKPTLGDFILHLHALSPDISIKSNLEIKATDSIPIKYAIGLHAMMIGIFYNKPSLIDVSSLIIKWKYKDLQLLQKDISINGLNCSLYDRNITCIIKDILNISYNGLVARNLQEERFLQPIYELIERKQTLAEKNIELFKSKNQKINIILDKMSIY